MILNSITLHNFMSYADARLDLTSIGVACLAGHNGAGKSALLDAVTWALWEAGRSSSDELIRIGAKEMWVEVCFTLEGQVYRVRRSRQKAAGKGGSKGQSKGTLEFQILSSGTQQGCNQDEGKGGGEPAGGEQARGAATEEAGGGPLIDQLEPGKGGGEPAAGQQGCGVEPATEEARGALPKRYISLTASSTRETQRRISHLFRMDYESFINSVYLRQGRADEFTMKPPAERKQVLADILGLSYFDRLQELAREKARQLKARIELLEATTATLPELESQIGDSRDQLERLQVEVAAAIDKVEHHQSTVTDLEKKLNALKLLEQKLEAGQTRAEELKVDIASLSQREVELSQRFGELSALIERSTEIENAAAEFFRLRSQAETMDQAALELQELTGRRLERQSELVNIRSRLEVDLEHWQAGLKELEAKESQLKSDSREREKLEAAYGQYRELVASESELTKRQEAHARLSLRADELKSLVTESRIRLEAEIQQKERSLGELDSLLTSTKSVQDEQARLKDESEVLDKLETEFQLVEEKGLRVKSDIEATAVQIQDLGRRQEENRLKVQELEQHSDSSLCPLCSAPIVDRLAVINRYRQQNGEMDRDIARLKDAQERLECERLELRNRYADLRRRLDTRKGLDTRIGQFNERVEAIERARNGQAELNDELSRLRSRLESQDFAQVERESLVRVRAEINKLDFDPALYSNLQAQIRMQRHIELRYQQLQRELNELKKVEAELPGYQAQVRELEGNLAREDYGSELRSELKEIQETITALNYDRQKHQLLKEQLSERISSGELARDLDRARIESPSLEESLKSCRERLAEKQEQIHKLEADLLFWQQEVAAAPPLLSQLEELKPVLAQWQTSRELISRQLAVSQSRMERLESEKLELEGRKQELKETGSQLDDYLLLAEAFGKKGIQAVIIENAVPEIESEANRILSRLSDNQMHVALATQHKTKAGNIVETLDLLIGDELGTRNYELYSGGEAFKVDFAVRVALSRLLARRAGAKLETLIIDEGFGSQDELSRDRLAKVIGSIRNDFARILVITHISEVKDMFPTQILVSKKNGTSQLTLSN